MFLSVIAAPLAISDISVAVLICGVDVQNDRLELEQYLTTVFDHETLATGLRIDATCLDTGDHHTQAAYSFCRGRERHQIWSIKGVAEKRPIWPKRPTKVAKGTVHLFGIGVETRQKKPPLPD